LADLLPCAEYNNRVQFHPDRFMGGCRPNVKDFVFVISKMYHT